MMNYDFIIYKWIYFFSSSLLSISAFTSLYVNRCIQSVPWDRLCAFDGRPMKEVSASGLEIVRQ